MRPRPRHLLPFLFAAALLTVASRPAGAAHPLLGDAAGMTVSSRADGASSAAGPLKNIPAASPAGEILSSLRGAPGLAAARSNPGAQITIDFRNDRVYRVVVTIPGGASSTLLSKPGGTTLDEVRQSEAASLLQLPANAAVRVQSVEGTGQARRVRVAGPLGQLPASGPLAGAAVEIREALLANPGLGALPPDNATPIRLTTDAAGTLVSFLVPRRAGGGEGDVEFARTGSAGAFAPVARAVSPPRTASAPEGSAAKDERPSAAAFLLGASPATPPFVRPLRAAGVTEVTLNVADLTPMARAQISRDLPGNALAARVGRGAEAPANNLKVTVTERDGGFTVTGLLPAAVVPADPLVRAASGDPADPLTDAAAALARRAVVGPDAPAPGSRAPGMTMTAGGAGLFTVTVSPSEMGAAAHVAVEQALRRFAAQAAAKSGSSSGIRASRDGTNAAIDRALDAFNSGAGTVDVSVRVSGESARLMSAAVDGTTVPLVEAASASGSRGSSSPETPSAHSPRFFSSDRIPSVSNTGANAGTGQRALPAGYVAALSTARAALANIPPAGAPGHGAAVITARARVSDLVTAFTRLDSDEGFQKSAEANARRAELLGAKGGRGSFATMNAAGVDPTPQQILRVYADVARMNAYRR